MSSEDVLNSDLGVIEEVS